MSIRSWQVRLDDILEAITLIEDYVASMDESAWRQDRKTIDAVIRNLEVIGEAAGQIPKEVQDAFPEIPWAKMKGMRNILAHEYFGVDSAILWQTIQVDLPELKLALAMIRRLASSDPISL